MVFSWLFLRHDGYIYLCFIACCETDSGLKVLENDVGELLSMTFILLGFGKVGFCEMFTKRGTLQKEWT